LPRCSISNTAQTTTNTNTSRSTIVSSPFAKKSAGSTATATAPAADPKTAAVASVGEDNKPVAKADPFMGQLVLLHFTEEGRMKTVNSGNEEDGKSPFCRVDVIPLTLPDEPGKFTNKYGEVETEDPFEVGQRLDDNLFFNKPLVREAKRAIERKLDWVIGRIDKGPRKEGQDAPVILKEATAEDMAIFEAWRASR
jgi:hypothetical protein